MSTTYVLEQNIHVRKQITLCYQNVVILRAIATALYCISLFTECLISILTMLSLVSKARLISQDVHVPCAKHSQ